MKEIRSFAEASKSHVPENTQETNGRNRSTESSIHRKMFAVAGLLGLFLCAGLTAAQTEREVSDSIREFPANGPVDLTPGPDGNIWFSEIAADKIGRITQDGVVTEFSVPTPNSFPHGIAAGPDGSVWFTEINGSKIGRITMRGVITEFSLPTSNSQPHDITPGPDGNLWFTEINADQIGRITPEGAITEFPLPTAGQQSGPGPCGPATTVSQPYVITMGPDRNLWFTECRSNRIARITPQGTITEFPVPTPESQPHGITTGPGGKLWFAEFAGNNIGIINTDGVVSNEIPIPTAKSGPHDLTVGPDRKIWFCEITANQIGRISSAPDHHITEIAVPNINHSPFGNLFAITSNVPILRGL